MYLQHIFLGQFISLSVFDYTRNYLNVTNPSNTVDGKYIHGLVAFLVSDDCSLALQWNAAFAAPFLYNQAMAATYAGGVVYVSSGVFNQVFAVDADTGELLWESPDMGNVYAPPTVVDGKMFVVNANYYADGVTSKMYAYALAPRPAPGPVEPVIDNFRVNISGNAFDLQSLATTGTLDAATNRAVQRLYTGADSTVSSGVVYVRLPIGGEMSTAGLPYGVDWTYTDYWLFDPQRGYVSVGKYDPATWVRGGAGSASVTYTGGTYCYDTQPMSLYSAVVTFKCAYGVQLSLLSFYDSACQCESVY